MLGIVLVGYAVIVSRNSSGKSASTVGIARVVELVVSLGAFIDRATDRALLPMLGVVLIGYGVIVRLNGSGKSASTVGVASVVELMVSLGGFVNRTADRALLPMLGIVLVGHGVIVGLNGSGKSASTVGVAGVVELVVTLAGFVNRTADRALLPMLGIVFVCYAVIVGCYGSCVTASTVGVAGVVKLVVSLAGFVNRAADRALLPMLGIVLVGYGVIVGCYGSYLSAIVTGRVAVIIVGVGANVKSIASRTAGNYKLGAVCCYELTRRSSRALQETEGEVLSVRSLFKVYLIGLLVYAVKHNIIKVIGK